MFRRGISYTYYFSNKILHRRAFRTKLIASKSNKSESLTLIFSIVSQKYACSYVKFFTTTFHTIYNLVPENTCKFVKQKYSFLYEFCTTGFDLRLFIWTLCSFEYIILINILKSSDFIIIQ